MRRKKQLHHPTTDELPNNKKQQQQQEGRRRKKEKNEQTEKKEKNKNSSTSSIATAGFDTGRRHKHPRMHSDRSMHLLERRRSHWHHQPPPHASSCFAVILSLCLCDFLFKRRYESKDQSLKISSQATVQDLFFWRETGLGL